MELELAPNMQSKFEASFGLSEAGGGLHCSQNHQRCEAPLMILCALVGTRREAPFKDVQRPTCVCRCHTAQSAGWRLAETRREAPFKVVLYNL